MSKQEVFRWHKKFEGGFIHLKDVSRPGQLKTGDTNVTRNIIVVTGLIERDARLTVRSIAHSVGISSGSAHKILTKQLL